MNTTNITIRVPRTWPIRTLAAWLNRAGFVLRHGRDGLVAEPRRPVIEGITRDGTGQ